MLSQKAVGLDHEETLWAPPKACHPFPWAPRQGCATLSPAWEEEKIVCVCRANPQVSTFFFFSLASEMSPRLCQDQETSKSAHRSKPCFVCVGPGALDMETKIVAMPLHPNPRHHGTHQPEIRILTLSCTQNLSSLLLFLASETQSQEYTLWRLIYTVNLSGL